MKKDPKNCWEFFNCPKEKKEKCIVHQLDVGECCHLFLNHIGKECYAYKLYDKCVNCPWYEIYNPSSIY